MAGKVYSAEDTTAIAQIAKTFGASIWLDENRGFLVADSLFQKMVPYREVFKPFLEEYKATRPAVSPAIERGLEILASGNEFVNDTSENVRMIVQIAQELGRSVQACRYNGTRPSVDLYKAMLPHQEVFRPVLEGMSEDRDVGIIVRDGLAVFSAHSHQD